MSFVQSVRQLVGTTAVAGSSTARGTHEPGSDETAGPQTRLSVRDLSKRFGDETVVSSVNIEVGADEIVALLGPSGCGKTTILRCIAGVERPDSGEIRIDGEVVEGPTVSRPPERRGVGMVYQNYAIWPHKTVFENVVFSLRHTDHDIPPSSYEARVESVLEMVEIAHLKDVPATDISGGQQQRTALARSLVHDPSLLLMDEPLSNLDVELRKTMRHELQRLQHELHFSMLYVTHNQEEAFYLADRVLVMKEGRIVEAGEPRALYERPTSPFTRSFIGGRNRIEGRIDVTPEGDRMVRTDLLDFPLETVDAVSDGLDSGPVACFIRPTDIKLQTVGGGGPGGLSIQGTVAAEGLLGGEYDVTVRFDGSDQELSVHTDPNQRLERGDDVYLRIQPKWIQVYRADRDPDRR